MAETTLSVAFSMAGQEQRPISYALHHGVNVWEQAEVLLNLTLEGAESDPAHFLGQEASLAIGYAFEPTKSVALHGKVTAAYLEDNSDGTSGMRLCIEGPLWPLKRRTQSKIFRAMTAKKIISELLQKAGITCKTEFHGAAFDRNFEFFVQYEELDSEFLLRFLAGLWASFLVVAAGEDSTVHFIEDVQAFSQQSLLTPYLPTFGEQTARLSVTDLQLTHRVTPDRVVMTAYDPKRPRLAIEATEQGTGESKNEIYFPLSRFTEETLNAESAKALLAGHMLRHKEVHGITGDLALGPTCAVTIEGHPYEALNGEFLVLEVTLVGALPREFQGIGQGENVSTIEFVAVPRDIPVKPEARNLTREVLGIQTAKTTGAAGEEIDVTADGEVSVAFPWDRSGVTDQNSSVRMRTAQLATGGAMLLPRVGWEVVVGFHEGNIDHPLVLSRLYNGGTMPPYALPEGALRSSLQTATSPGDGSSNELRFDDTKSSEQMFFNASKNMTVDVGNNTTHSVGNDHKVTVAVDQSLTVIDSNTCTVGVNQTIDVGGNQAVSVATLQVDDITGDHSTTVGGNETQMIGGDQRTEVAANSELTIGGNSMMAVVGSVTANVSGKYDLTVGAASIAVIAGDRSLIVGGARTETTGAAKVLVTKGTRAVEAGSLATTIGGAVLAKVTGDRAESAGATWSEVAGGLQKIEAEELVIEADAMLTITMGASVISLNPAMATVTGTNVKLDGNVVEVAPLIVTN
jgi:type VI secretion system secreted protein VgrG